MTWNIGLLCIKADPTVVENETYLDILYKSKEGLHFEEITSVTMGSSIGVGHVEAWTLIFDTNARFIFDEKFPLEVSKKFKVKTFWISESLIYRDYHFGIYKKGGIKTEVKGIEERLKYLSSIGIKAKDEWGETIIFQIIEKEILNKPDGDFVGSIRSLPFAKYDLD
ncbi:hypothetical protein GC098_37615 [Paenibacillus sp. LMG 31458]|uniref:Uncharacterized protein n=1 Tax=Paenibacillus phytorum TaxID=2654977 RepID=A0ABX1Y816_9BACL|nr:hypothetical protein [Paenibacillus phytorum]NOU77017.1 hypothetical protein [Paenibacillus phytorum]